MRFIPGWCRQLTTHPPEPDFVPTGTFTGRMTTGKDMNVRIQSAAADIVTKLIAADIIHSQRWDQVDEIVRDILFAAFGGTGLASAPQPITKSR